MAQVKFDDLLEAGVHFGHLKRKWNPNMAPYIFDEKKGIHVIDLNKTVAKLDEAASAMKQIAKSGKKILFVATKKQARDIVEDLVKPTNMPYVVERWPGGMLTNFGTTRRAIRKMASIDKMLSDGTIDTLAKRERLQVARQRAKLEKNLGSISDLTRLPAAIFIVDVNKEHIAVKEARKLNIPTFAMVDTNSDPTLIDFPVPSNDDAAQSIQTIMTVLVDAVKEGLAERKAARGKEAPKEEKEKEGESKDKKADAKAKPRTRKAEKMASSTDAEEKKEAKKEDKDDKKAEKPKETEAKKEEKPKAKKVEKKADADSAAAKKEEPKAKKTEAKAEKEEAPKAEAKKEKKEVEKKPEE